MCALPLLGSSGTAARIHIFVWPCTARGSRLSCKTPPLITGDKSEYEPRAQSACAYKARICYGKVVMRPAAVASAHGIAAPLRFRDQPAGSDVRLRSVGSARHSAFNSGSNHDAGGAALQPSCFPAAVRAGWPLR